MQRILCLAVLLCGLHAGRAATVKRTDGRDIVFAARYYLKPGSAGKSHFHLYRIRPNGTGKMQLTFGNHDEADMHWSPAGQRLVFVRDENALYVCDADGHKLRSLGVANGWLDTMRWSPDSRTLGFYDGKSNIVFVDIATGRRRQLPAAGEFQWSPNGRYLAVERDGGVTLIELATHRETQLPANTSKLAWLGSDEIVVALGKTDNPFVSLVVYGLDGRERRRLPIQAKNPEFAGDEIDWRSRMSSLPGTAKSFIFEWNESTSSGRNARYYVVDAQTGVARDINAEGPAFAPAPDSKHFVFSAYHDTKPYDVLPNGHPRVVYTAPLCISDGHKRTTLVSGLVMTYGCDWR